MTQFPPAWYPTDDGRLRWWDGAAWTDHFAPAVSTPAAEAEVAAEQGSEAVVDVSVNAESESVDVPQTEQAAVADDASLVESWFETSVPQNEAVVEQASYEEISVVDSAGEQLTVEVESFEQASVQDAPAAAYIDNEIAGALRYEFQQAAPEAAAPTPGFVGPPNSPFPGQHAPQPFPGQQGFTQPQVNGAPQQFSNQQQYPNQQFQQPGQNPQFQQQSPQAGGYQQFGAANGAYGTPQAGYNAPQPSKKSSKTGLIIGLSIGGLLVVALVLWLVFALVGGQSNSSSPLGAAQTFGTAMADGDCLKLEQVTSEEFFDLDISYFCDEEGNYAGEGVRFTNSSYDLIAESNGLAEVAWTTTISFSASELEDLFGDFDIDGLLDDTGIADYLPEETVTNVISLELVDGEWIVFNVTN